MAEKKYFNDYYLKHNPLLTQRLGWLAIGLYCLATAVSSVWVNYSFSTFNSEALIFFTVLVAQLSFFTLFCLKQGNFTFFIITNFKSVAILNVLTLFCWLFMFMALQKIEASVESAIYQGWIPIIVIIVEYLIHKGLPKKSLIISVLFLAFFLGLLGYTRVYFDGGINDSLIQGVIYASIAGVTAALYMVYSEFIFYKRGFTVLNILASRFIMLLIYIVFSSHDSIRILYESEFTILVNMAILSLTFIVVPIYLLQYSIVTLGSGRVSIITPLVPSVALGLEYFYLSWDNYFVPILVILVCISVLFANYYKSKKTVRE
ncbi:hypothetical protein OHV10_18665 [Vibrio splendidus]|uniref:hypothetical protein n=1 Tax=Vibrio splendidus TaxID=29497 RepID=UPI0022358013|nr:hypothetical protein [Vibrio splendidus]MCW4446271.1 hypothetical protein [Vibrio splendidus]